VFTGCISKETYLPLLKLAKDAHMNLLRSWGGAIVNKDSFFDLCDEMGLMVWQEFPLACNNYRGTPHYLKALEPEASSIIKRLRSRACLALWCGGNELFNSWSGMSEHSPALRLLNALTFSLDPSRPFLPTSPLSGMGHGGYIFRTEGQEVFQSMPKARFTAYTEFGVPSISSLETCLAATDMENLFPLQTSPITRAHHAFGMWGPYDTWSCVDTIRSCFGQEESLEELIGWSQWIQSEGYKCIFEEARRQKPYCSMALNWCYNEAWPAIANNSLINWPAIPKPAYFAAADSCRPRLASARIPKFTWQPGETFEADLHLLNDSRDALPPGEVAVCLSFRNESHLVMRWAHNGTEANKNLQGPTVRFHMPKAQLSPDETPLNARSGGKRKYAELTLRLESGPLSSEYRLVLYLS
jgi:beta-mannosidase